MTIMSGQWPNILASCSEHIAELESRRRRYAPLLEPIPQERPL